MKSGNGVLLYRERETDRHTHTHIQIVSLGVKSGNGVLFKCGRKAVVSCQVIVGAINDGLSTSKVCVEEMMLFIGT